MKRNNLNELEAFWSNRYKDQNMGWNLGSISDPIRYYINQLKDKTIKILVPGAGNAYEAEYFYKSGFINTYIIDISEHPLTSFKARVPEFPDDQIIHGDFFSLNDTFDLIVEQTFMCSFPPIDNNREKYAEKMFDLLKPKGKLVGLWFNFPFTGDLEKRPFGGTKSEYLELFSTHFKITTFEDAYNSVPSREGQELFGIFKKEAS